MSRKRISSPAYGHLYNSSRELCATRRLPSTGRKAAQWTKKQDELLRELRSKDLSWQAIAQHVEFREKTDNACRKRHERMVLVDKHTEVSNNISMIDMSRVYMDVRREMWAMVAQRFGSCDWEVVERKAFSLGLMTMKNTAREQRPRPGPSRSEQPSQITGIEHNTGIQTPPSTDDEEPSYGPNAEYATRASTPQQHPSPTSFPQTFKPMYYGHPQSLPVLPNPLPLATTSHITPQPPYQSPALYTLPAVQHQEYGSPHPRTMLPGPEYDMSLRYSSQPTTDPYQHSTMANPAYHQHITPSPRHEELVGIKMSVQSMLSEPDHLQHSYTGV